ncbi:MAG: hypothetical protein D6725_12235 [Planctomycetota bacterium]|nr:MAG: hypothetical protein D6725_12235 [Planctomycetota bacterium]
MVGYEYLEKGVWGLANAHRAGPLAGHLGAALLAGYFLGEDHGDWPAGVFAGIQSELDRILRGEEAIWFNPRQAGLTVGDLFKPLAGGRPVRDADRQIAAALRTSMDRLRQSGHNVIFGSLAIRAVQDHPDLATPRAIDGLVRLMRQFATQRQGRGYYGKAKGWKYGHEVQLTDSQTVHYRDLSDMLRRTLDETARMAGVHRRGFGGLWHLINHAAGLLELHRRGFRDLAELGRTAHARHLALLRTLPDVSAEFGAYTAAAHDPRDPAYWKDMLKRDEARLTHRIKTLYGFFAIAERVSDAAARRRAEHAFLYLMA